LKADIKSIPTEVEHRIHGAQNGIYISEERARPMKILAVCVAVAPQKAQLTVQPRLVAR
jgi:hypothetical protein